MDSSSEEPSNHHQKSHREICGTGCDRPKNVCLCHVIPQKPLPTDTKVVILHHPHERRHKLATVPVLSKCLLNCQIIVGRKLKYGQSKLLDSLYDQSSPNSSALYLFPGPNATSLSKLNRYNNNDNNDVTLKGEDDSLVLIAFDGTWKHAKEMVLASLPFISKFAIQVCLDFDVGVHGGTIYDSDLILRKEPFLGCMSTMEAVARCLRFLEPLVDNGVVVESKIVEVLRTMVSFQACFIKPATSFVEANDNNEINHEERKHIEACV